MAEEPDTSLSAHHANLEAIGELGGVEALVALGTLAERSRREAEGLSNDIIEGLTHDRDQWKKEAEQLRAQLWAVRDRFEHLLYSPPGKYRHE